MKTFYDDALSSMDISLDLSERLGHSKLIDEETLAIRLSRFYRTMLVDQANVAPVWKPAGEWKDYNDEKGFFYRPLLEGDIAKVAGLLKNFWRNRLGLIVKEYARFDQLASGEEAVTRPFVRSIGRNFLIWKDLFHLPSSRLSLRREVGNPWGCKIEGTLVTPKATRFHTNAMQLRSLLRACDGRYIGEIGAGYGGLCHYLIQEVPDVRYVDLDLPETLVLAAYSLISNFPELSIFLYGEKDLDAKAWEEHQIFLLPNYLVESLPEKLFDVTFNSFSLSEMPPEVNNAYLNQIGRLTRSYFFHNNMDRSGVVNRGFERIPASCYPMDPNRFNLLSQGYDLFHAHCGDYKEFLYKVK